MDQTRKLGFSPEACGGNLTERLRALELEECPQPDTPSCSPIGLAFGHLGRHGLPVVGCRGCGFAQGILELVEDETDRSARSYILTFVEAIDDGIASWRKLAIAFVRYRQAALEHEKRVVHPVLSAATLWRGFFLGFGDVLWLGEKALLRARETAQRDLLGSALPSKKTRGRPPLALRDRVQAHLQTAGLKDREIAELLGLEGFTTPPKEIVRKGRRRKAHAADQSGSPTGKK